MVAVVAAVAAAAAAAVVVVDYIADIEWHMAIVCSTTLEAKPNGMA